MVIVKDRTYEYYFDDGKIIFAFVTEGNGYPEQRLYCFKSTPFKLLYGKENLLKENDDFWDYSDAILGVYFDYISGE